MPELGDEADRAPRHSVQRQVRPRGFHTQCRRKYRTNRKTPNSNKAEQPDPTTAPRKKPLHIQLPLPWNARLTPPTKAPIPHRTKQTPVLQWPVFVVVIRNGLT